MTWQRGTHPSLLGNATLQVVKEVKEEDGTVVKEVVKSFPLLGEEPLGEKPVNAPLAAHMPLTVLFVFCAR